VRIKKYGRGRNGRKDNGRGKKGGKDNGRRGHGIGSFKMGAGFKW
jgi:hypothetical protein